MKKKDIPQDPSVLDKFTREVSYALDEKGHYTTELSRGWEVKASALSVSWENIKERVEEARAKVMNEEASPVLFFMELRIMDLQTLAAYTGFWKWTVKRHLNPKIFNRLSDTRLSKYAEVFEVDIIVLKHFKENKEKIDALILDLKNSTE